MLQVLHAALPSLDLSTRECLCWNLTTHRSPMKHPVPAHPLIPIYQDGGQSIM